MTAFARAERTTDDGDLTWELRTVNHRFFEPTLRLPEELRALDPEVRERLAARIGRGKLDCTLRYRAADSRDQSLALDERLLDRLLATTERIARRTSDPTPPSALELLRWPGVLRVPEPDLAALGQAALTLLEVAIADLVAARAREGARLAETIARRGELLAEQVAAARALLPDIRAHLRQRLRERLAELAATCDANRLEQEVALLVQRADVDEELDRLSGHLTEIRDILAGGGPVGRRLDFLMQELNREANTLAAKSAALELTRVAVEMKVLIEQMREQIQNLE